MPEPHHDSALTKLRRALQLDLALRLVWQSAPGWTLAHLVLIVLQGLLPLATVYLTKLVLDTAVAGVMATDKRQAFQRALLYVGLVGGAQLLGVALSSVGNVVSTAQSTAVQNHVSGVIQAKSVAVDLAYYENPDYYDKLHRAQHQGLFRPVQVVNDLAQTLQHSVSLLAMGGLLLSFDWSMGLILLLAVTPGIWSRLRYAHRQYALERRQTEPERQAYYYNAMLTGGSFAKEIRLFDLGALFMRRFRELRECLRREKLRLTAGYALQSFIVQGGSALAVFAAYALFAYRTIEGRITLGDLMMYYQAFERGVGALKGILGDLARLYEDNLFLTNLDDFLALEATVVDPPEPVPLPQPWREGLVVEHLSFHYPDSPRHALEDVSLTIAPGEVIALVGENGSGKTTLAKLLCRLYDPLAGRITLDGVDLRQFEVAALRREIAVIFQDYVQYQMSVQENIWMGNAATPPDPAAIQAAARRAGADAVVSKLPQGYATPLGKWFGGEELSTGEWQKIALARAFLRDARLIVLDEPTSAMDARAEHEVFTKFRELIHGRAAVLISHRFSTVRAADRIYVLDRGRILEHGTHDALMRRGGTYAQLYEMQAQHYR